MVEEKKQESKMSGNKIFLGVLALLAILSIASAVYFYGQYQHSQLLLQNPTLAATQQAQATIDAVGKLIQLPIGETPTIATVSDYTKLQDQPFFANAKNGDKVLIYTKAREAILYDPSANKIINVAPVNIGANETPTPSPVTSKLTKVTPKPTSARK